jgi:hypothetical protein
MKLTIRAIGASLLLAASTGCVHHHHHHPQKVVRAPGPPAHAPAHGHRRHHGGPELVYDSQLGVHVVVGRPDVFFHDGHFFRFEDGAWHVSVSLDGGWATARAGQVPPGLAKKYGHHQGSHGKAKHPAKHGRDRGD